MLMKTLAITTVVSFAFATATGTGTVTGAPLRECESKNVGVFDTNCDAKLYFPSLPFCGKGQRLINACVDSSQVSEACTSCDVGSFQSFDNHCSTCRPCTVCEDDGRRTVVPCSAEEDAVCESLDPSDIDSQKTVVPASQTATDSPKTVAPSGPAATDSSKTAAPSTMPPGTASGEASISTSTTITLQDDAVTHIDVDEKGVTSVQDGNCKAVTPLVVCVVILAVLLVVAVIVCFYYKGKADANRRRYRNGNADEDVEGNARRCIEYIPVGEGASDKNHVPQPSAVQHWNGITDEDVEGNTRRYIELIPMLEDARDENHVAQPSAVSPRNGIADEERSPCLNHDDPGEGPSCQASPTREPLYATVNKLGSSKGSPKQESAMPISQAVGPVPSDGHTESGGSKASLHSTVPPPSSPSQSPPLPSPLPKLEGPLQQSTGTSPPPSLPPLPSSLTPLPASPPPPTSSLPPPSSPLPPTSSTPPSSPLPPSSTVLSSPPPPSSTPPPSSPPPPPISSTSPPSSSRKKAHLNSSQLPTGATVRESDVEENEGEEDTRDDATNTECDSKAHPPEESSSCSDVSTPSRVTENLERGAEGGTGSLPPVSPGEKPKVKSLPEPRDDVGEKAEEELKKSSIISPDEVVSERFLDGVTDVISLDEVERISRKLGLQQTVIDNVKQSLLYTDPKNIGFHILRKVLFLRGCELTFQRVLVAMRDCGQKNAGDTLIAEFKIKMNLERR